MSWELKSLKEERPEAEVDSYEEKQEVRWHEWEEKWRSGLEVLLRS